MLSCSCLLACFLSFALSFFFPDSLVYVVDDEYYKVSLQGFVFEGVKGKGEREEVGKIGGNGEI